MSSCVCRWPWMPTKPIIHGGAHITPPLLVGNGILLMAPMMNRRRPAGLRVCEIRASVVDSPDSASNFAKRVEQAWLISQQPAPVACSTCNSNGNVECKWCGATGFFMLGDNMLCEVVSKSTSCVICGGKGWMQCSDCKGSGYRARWLQDPPISKD